MWVSENNSGALRGTSGGAYALRQSFTVSCWWRVLWAVIARYGLLAATSGFATSGCVLLDHEFNYLAACRGVDACEIYTRRESRNIVAGFAASGVDVAH